MRLALAQCNSVVGDLAGFAAASYLRGVPYVEHGKYRPGHGANAFSPKEWGGFQKRAAELNRSGEGDTACFYLRAR